MKALRLQARGGPEQLVYEDVPVPTPATGEVLVRVHATGITPTELMWDETYKNAKGSERIPSIPGHELSGVVETLGRLAEGLALGDEVYGLIDFPCDGSAAEYVTIPAGDLAPKPRTLDHVHAAAIPLSALTAWQALFDQAHLVTGQRVLIHGAAGGVGAYAVQLAKWRGVEVFATASGRHAQFLQELGVNTLIDYETTQFESIARDMDAVLDPFGGEMQQRSWQTLRPGGTLVGLTAPIINDLQRRSDVTGVFFIVRPNRAQLIKIGELVDAGNLRPFVEATYKLSAGQAAYERGLAGHLRGKIVLNVLE